MNITSFTMKLIYVLVLFCVYEVQAQEDGRCVCVCPNPSIVNVTQYNKLYYDTINNTVAPDQCTCEFVIIPKFGDEIKPKEREFCPRCDCKYETRNTAIIKYVVIIVIWIISLLVIYMLFLICLDPLLNKRMKGNYQEHTNEEEEAGGSSSSGGPGTSSHPMGVRANVLNRVGHQQDKWKRQVKEQRRNIYVRHTMLN